MNMEVLKLPKNPYNIQKCLLPPCQFLKENYGQICIVSFSTDLHCIVKIGMCESKITDKILYIDDSVIVCSSSQYIVKKGNLDKINVNNFKILKKPHLAKIVDIDVVFYDIFEMETYKNDQKVLVKTVKDILKFYVFCNKSTIFLDSLEIHKRFFIKFLIISCRENLNVYQPYEIYSGTEINIKTCISELQIVNSQIKHSHVELGGYHKISRILDDIIKFAFVISYKRKVINKLLLTGPQGCGKTSLVRHVSNKNKYVLLEIKACEIISLDVDKIESILQDVFKAAKIYASLNECCIILIKNIEIISFGRRSYSNKFAQTLITLLEDIKKKNGIIVIATSNCSEKIDSQLTKTGRFEDELEITYPTADEREEITYLIFKKHKIFSSKTLLTQISKWTAGFAGSDLNILVIEALKLYYKKHKGLHSPLDCQALQDCFKQVLKKLIPEVIKDAISLNGEKELKMSSIGGLENVKSILDLAVIKQLQNFEKFYKLGISFTNGILLYGPPGCAKTSLVKALAKECNARFFVASAADLYSPYVGDTEKKLIKLFSLARMSSPSIIFIDEIDSVMGSKSKKREQGIQERILATLLLEMDGISSKILVHDKHPLNFLEENRCINKKNNLPPKELNFGVIILGATNRPHLLDEALMRPGRFDRLVYIPPPNEAERFQILTKFTENMPLHESVDLETLAKLTNFYTGADLKNLCQESGLYAIQSSGKDTECVHQSHFEQIIFGLKPSLNKKIVDYYKSFQINNVPY